MPLSAPVPIGTTLENRYEVVRFLGHGGFGRTYLVKDQHRFHELCVLKEFAPQVSQPSILQKAEELFTREAGTLYRLEHPQIPEFRAMSSVQLNGEKVVFLVEQFIDGYNYGEWVEQGHCLSEVQGLQLLRDLLPVLSYIHSKGVIHRDIAPDNIMCDRATGKPILIDFGSVKQVAQTALQMVSVNPQATQIHKPGYTPLEQIKGEVHPNSDLYALAVTVLVLMAGQAPVELFDTHYQVWNWQRFIRLDNRFESVLYRMLGRHTSDRYRNAEEVLQALSGLQVASVSAASSRIASPIPVTIVPQSISQVVAQPVPVKPSVAAASQSPNLSSVKTIAVAPVWNPPPPTQAPAPIQQPVGYSAHHSAAQQPIYSPPGYGSRPAGNWLWRSIKALLLLPFRIMGAVLKLIWGGIRLVDMMFTWLFRLMMIAVVMGLLAVGAVFGKPDWLPNISLPPLPSLPLGSTASNQSQGCQDLQSRADRSGMTYAQLNTQVNQKFYKRYPNLRNRALTDRTEDQALRDSWCEMADEMLKRSERR